MTKGQLSYRRITYKQADDPFHSGTAKENITIAKAVSLMANYLKRNRSSPSHLSFDNGRVFSEIQQRYVYSTTASEAWIEKTPPFTEVEFDEFKKLVEIAVKQNKTKILEANP